CLPSPPPPLHPPSFPTRRSSDLQPAHDQGVVVVLLSLGDTLRVVGVDQPAQAVESIASPCLRHDVRIPGLDGPQIDPAVSLELGSEEHTSELQSRENLVCRLLLE